LTTKVYTEFLDDVATQMRCFGVIAAENVLHCSEFLAVRFPGLRLDAGTF